MIPENQAALETYAAQLALQQSGRNLKPFESETIQYLRELTDTTQGTPKRMLNLLWSFNNKVHQLTCIDRIEAQILLNEAELIIAKVKLYTPRRYKTGQWEIELQQMLLNFRSAINRSIDGFERKRQGTTTSETSFNQGGGNPLVPVPQQKRRWFR